MTGTRAADQGAAASRREALGWPPARRVGHRSASRRDDRRSPPHRAGGHRRLRRSRGHPSANLAGRDPAAWIGARGLEATGGRPIFPLLVKLIDGQADLSIQVHPDDRAAAAAGLGTGKTEAYHVLAAEPGSVIYLGLGPEVTAGGLRGLLPARRWLGRRVPAPGSRRSRG